jgi:hypothetical protein
MNKMTKFGVLGMLLLLLLPSAIQGGPVVVKLTVKRDGQEIPGPTQITLTFNNHSVVVPVRSGKFEVPPEAVKARSVVFAANVGDDCIRIYVSGENLTMEDWTLLIAEGRYDDEYQWMIPKGTNIPASCIIAYMDSGIFTFYPHCRSRRK